MSGTELWVRFVRALILLSYLSFEIDGRIVRMEIIAPERIRTLQRPFCYSFHPFQMTDDELKQKFLEEIKKTEALIVEYRELAKPIAPDAAIGRVSRMDAINNKSINDAALRKSEEKLKKLKFAMSKVGSPQFGICGKCGTDIPPGRILIKPESMYCVNCAQ